MSRKTRDRSHLDEAPAQDVGAAVASQPTITRTRELIRLADIVDDGHNHRLSAMSPAENKRHQARIDSLAESLKLDGLLQEILVYRSLSGHFHRVYGSRRCEAAQQLGWTQIPANVLAAIPTAPEIQRMRAVENLQRQDLSPAEQALAAWELVEAHAQFGISGGRPAAMERAAADMGEKPSWIHDRVYVVDRLTKKTRELLQAGVINLSQARELATIGGDHQEFIARDIAESFEDGIVWDVERIRGEIANRQRGLKVVPWELGVAMSTGVKGCQTCLGCPHNTASDLTLFQTGEKDEVDAAAGYCRLPEGFEAKQKMTAKAQEKIVDAVRAKVKAKEIEKADAGGIEVIRAAAPEFVKQSSAQRVVRNQLGLGKEAAKRAERVEAKAKEDPRKGALQSFGGAYQRWYVACEKAIELAALKKPALLLCYLALEKTEAWGKRPKYEVPSEYGSNPQEPSQELPASPVLMKLLKCAAKEDAEAIACDIDHKSLNANTWGHVGPELMQAWAKAFGAKIGPPPVLAPKDALPAAEGKPGKKGKAAVEDEVDVFEDYGDGEE